MDPARDSQYVVQPSRAEAAYAAPMCLTVQRQVATGSHVPPLCFCASRNSG